MIHRRPEEDTDGIVSALWELHTRGIVEEAEGLRAFFDDAQDTASIRAALSGYLTESREERPLGLGAFERTGWDALCVGERFFVAPSWVTGEPPPGRHRLTLDATAAFGTGRHESTQLALRALERCVKPGMTVLDIGCGSGILSLAAQALGADRTISCDVDSNAIESARQHLVTPLFFGSADSVSSKSADITVANISARVVDLLSGELSRVTKAEGRLIIGGFLTEAPPLRFTPDEVLEQDGWGCWICNPEKISSEPDGEESASLQNPDRWWV